MPSTTLVYLALAAELLRDIQTTSYCLAEEKNKETHEIKN